MKNNKDPIIEVTENEDGSITIDYDEKHSAFIHLEKLSDDEKVAFFADVITKGLARISEG